MNLLRGRGRAAVPGVVVTMALTLSSLAVGGVLSSPAHAEAWAPLPDLGMPVVFGKNDSGEAQPFVAPPGATRYVDIAVGHGVSLGLTDTGAIVGAGRNWAKQVDVPALPSGATRFTSVELGTEHALALTDDGQVVAWGRGGNGELDVPPLPAGATKFVGVFSAGTGKYSAALTDDGQVLLWGSDEGESLDALVLPAGAQGFTDVAVGVRHAAALTDDGRIVAVGSNAHGQTNIAPLVAPEQYVEVDAGTDFTVAVTSTGRVEVFGAEDTIPFMIPTSPVGYVAVEAGHDHVILTDAEGEVTVHRHGGDGEGDVPEYDTIVGVAAGYRSTAFLTQYSGVVWGGSARFGHTELPNLDYDGEYAAVAAGEGFTVALDAGGHLVGRGRADHRQYPAGIGADSVYSAIDAGASHTVALRRVGVVSGFGNDSAADFSSLPTEVPYVAVAAGTNHSVVLDEQGVIRGVGENGRGQLDAPTLPAGARTWTAVAAGEYFSLALTDTGLLRGFGYGFQESSERNVPQLPEGSTSWVAVDAGGSRAIALSNTGVAVVFTPSGGASTRLELPAGAHRFVEVGVHGGYAAGVTDSGELVTVNAYGGSVPVAPELPAGRGYVSVDVGDGQFATLTRPLHEQSGVGVEIAGTAVVGGTLTASVTGAPAADPVTGGTSAGYRWSADGVELLGSTGATLEVTPDMLGKTISVAARLVRFEHEPTTVNSTMTAAVEPGVQAAPEVSIEGLAAVGQTLTGQVTSVADDAEVAWAWKRGEETVSTSRAYVAGVADLGQRLEATATITRRGYRPVSASALSAEVAEVAETFTVAVPKKVRSQKTFVAAVSGMRRGEAFTARFGKQTVTGTADAQGTARVTFVAPLKNRDLGLQVTVTGSVAERGGSASVTVLGRTIAATVRTKVVRAGERQVVTLKRLGKGERVVIVRDGKRVVVRASKHGTYTYRFAAGASAGVKKLKVNAVRTGRSVTVTWRVRR